MLAHKQRTGKETNRPALMRCSQGYGNKIPECGDTEADLYQQQAQHALYPDAEPALHWQAQTANGKTDTQHHKQVGKQAMIELDGGDILEYRQPERIG